MSSSDFKALKDRARLMWGAGDWPSVAESVAPVSERLVARLDVGPETTFLDIGGGSATPPSSPPAAASPARSHRI